MSSITVCLLLFAVNLKILAVFMCLYVKEKIKHNFENILNWNKHAEECRKNVKLELL